MFAVELRGFFFVRQKHTRSLRFPQRSLSKAHQPIVCQHGGRYSLTMAAMDRVSAATATMMTIMVSWSAGVTGKSRPGGFESARAAQQRPLPPRL